MKTNQAKPSKALINKADPENMDQAIEYINELRQEVTDTDEMYTECEQERREYEEQIDDLNDEIKGLENDVTKLENQIDEHLPDVTGKMDLAKLELFNRYFDKFSLEDFEQFLESKKILIYS